MDSLQAVKDALDKDRAGFQSFLTDTLQARKTTPNIYTLPDGGTVIFQEGWIEFKHADGRRLFGNLRGGPPEKQEPEVGNGAIFDHLFNGGNIQDFEDIEILLEQPNTTLTKEFPDGKAVSIHIGDKGLITAKRIYPDGTQERAGYWIPTERGDLDEDKAFTTSCMEQCLINMPRRGRGR